MTRDINADPYRLQRSKERNAARAARPKRRTSREVVLDHVATEREAQDAQWGGADHDDSHLRSEWLSFVADHHERALKANVVDDCEEYRKQLIEIAALAVAAIESHDRKQRRSKRA